MGRTRETNKTAKDDPHKWEFAANLYTLVFEYNLARFFSNEILSHIIARALVTHHNGKLSYRLCGAVQDVMRYQRPNFVFFLFFAVTSIEENVLASKRSNVFTTPHSLTHSAAVRPLFLPLGTYNPSDSYLLVNYAAS